MRTIVAIAALFGAFWPTALYALPSVWAIMPEEVRDTYVERHQQYLKYIERIHHSHPELAKIQSYAERAIDRRFEKIFEDYDGADETVRRAKIAIAKGETQFLSVIVRGYASIWDKWIKEDLRLPSKWRIAVQARSAVDRLARSKVERDLRDSPELIEEEQVQDERRDQAALLADMKEHQLLTSDEIVTLATLLDAPTATEEAVSDIVRQVKESLAKQLGPAGQRAGRLRQMLERHPRGRPYGRIGR